MLKGIFLSLMIMKSVNADPIQVSEEELKGALKKEIDRVMPISNEFEITLSTPNINLVKESPEDELVLQDFIFEAGSYRFTAKATTASNVKNQKNAPIRGQVNLIVDVPVVTHIINPGDEITEADIAWQKMPANSVNTSVIQNKDDLIGKTPRSVALKPGMVIRKSDLKAPILIKKNESALITYKDEGINISTIGQAKQDGAKGELIRFSIPNSKKEIQAAVTTKGKAEILVVG